MTPFAQLCLLTRCALGTEPSAAAALAVTRLDGPALVRLSLRHRIAPFLASLATDPELARQLPEELRVCLTLTHEANAARNLALLEQVVTSLAVLNAAGIDPVLLKGAARLVDGTYPDLGGRFLEDIDLLVPEEQVKEAAAALEEAGYRPSEAEASWLAEDHNHLPTLCRDDAVTGIELHRAVVPPWHASLLPAPEFLARSSQIVVAGHRARLPADTDALLHLAVHSQLLHHRLLSGAILLSDVVEQTLLVRRTGVDTLRQAADLAQARGLAVSVGTFLEVCQQSAGTPLPSGVSNPNLAKLLARRAIWQQDRRLVSTVSRLLVLATKKVMLYRRYPSFLKRLPARLGKRDFYASRLSEIRRVLMT